ncbi:mutS protein [Planoprotostelium fungivorum]|uniref:MutS protein n=1 Tax=Planoprotostelium fungivorum TaxID=1890364 RepID=A0A2P6MVL9_9EUKA|nr:mutS protein [Planoprotostelium fungivorum]
MQRARYDVHEANGSEPPNKRSRNNHAAVNNRSTETIYVVSISENKSREIGLATIDLKSPNVIISQFVDTHTFIHTLSKLYIYQPVEIIVSETATASDLSVLIQNRFPDANFTSVQRKYFNEDKEPGRARNVLFYGVGIFKQVECLIMKKTKRHVRYLALASTAALIKYVEYIQSISFSSHSLRLTVLSAHCSIIMDSETIQHLEIITNRRNNGREHTLLGVMDHTKTAVGARLLKSNLVQPLCNINTLEARLDVVDVFCRDEKLLSTCRQILSQITDMDQLIHSMQLITVPTQASLRESTTIIKAIIKMKHTIELVSRMAPVVRDQPCELLRAIHDTLSDATLPRLRDRICEIIDEKTVWSKGASNVRNLICFAVKPGINGLLDVARKTYLETSEGEVDRSVVDLTHVKDMNALLRDYQVKYNMPQLKLQYNAKRGFFLTLDRQIKCLPSDFIQTIQQGKKIKCTTVDLQRMNDSMNEIIMLTGRIVEELSHDIRTSLGCIYKTIDAVAILDMLQSFAIYTKGCTNAARPEFSDNGPLVIKQGRHPIAEKISPSSFVPNDTYVTDASNFHVITGPNMSGKSTYIKQVALLTVMAFVGSYVPAQYASLRMVDRILTRLGTGDQIETRSSSFFKEMSEMSYILGHVTDNSLVVVDELGRATSTMDGLSIAWSISEHLACTTKAHTLFVTHFDELTELKAIYPNIDNYHMMANDTRSLYQIGQGVVEPTHYGIMLAARAGLDKDIVREALDICTSLEKEQEEERTKMKEVYEPSILYHEIAHRLYGLKNSTLDQESLRHFMIEMRKNYKSLPESSSDVWFKEKSNI